MPRRKKKDEGPPPDLSKAPRIRVKVTPPSAKAIIVYDEDTRELLLIAITYNKKVKPGEYTEPEEIVTLFHTIATRSHNTKNPLDPLEARRRYVAIAQLLHSNLPFADKLEEVLRYARRR